jgi:hypothetical protein
MMKEEMFIKAFSYTQLSFTFQKAFLSAAPVTCRIELLPCGVSFNPAQDKIATKA